MHWLSETITLTQLQELERWIGEGFFVVSIAFLVLELVWYAVRRRLTWSLAGDTATNFITSLFFLAVSFVLFFAFYVSALFFFHTFAVFDIPVNGWTLILCIVLADFAYYWEHRFSHRVAAAWATHTVHHSSPYFNISVAYRFGPMDGFWTVLFHIPLVLIGFDPHLVFFAEAMVLLYQTALHTEVISKLPKPIEAIFNTPSHHRVHHGSNDAYIDKNYGGVLIVWDRFFGTFAEERETVVYGITEPLDSVNPFVVFLHGLARLRRTVSQTPGLGRKLAVLIRPPG